MRRVLSGLGLFLLLGALAPGIPAAAVPAGTPTTIYVLMVADLDSRVAGRPSDFTAVLGADGSPGAVSGETLRLWVQPVGTTAFVEAGHATTDASGTATVWATLDHNAVARWTHDSSAPYDASTSATFGVEVAPRITARVRDRTLRRHQRLVVSGQTFPVKAGCMASLWKGRLAPLTTGPSPVRLARSTVRADGSYRLVRRFHRARAMRVTVVVASCAGNARGTSRSFAIRVR